MANAEDIELSFKKIHRIVNSHKIDWDPYETSWDFQQLPLLTPDHYKPTLKDTCAAMRQHWRDMTKEMKQLEEENNRIFRPFNTGGSLLCLPPFICTTL